VFSIIEAAGWPIWPLIICSVIALAIIGERMWTLRRTAVLPTHLLAQVVSEHRQKGITPEAVARLTGSSPLGQVFAGGLRNVDSPPEVMKEAIEESGRAVALELERFLTTLGTIAAIGPLLGLFGTVIGMIEIFGSQTPQGGSNPLVLAHGISIALYNTAYGLVVAVPSMIFYRYFRAKVDAMLVDMELQSLKLVEVIHGERRA
jgi:biopolymer transport protein ExbB